MRTPPKPKPALAEWIQRERKKLGLKNAQELADRLALVGVHVSKQTVQVWEGNNPRPPKPETIAVLERLFDSSAPVEHEGGDQSDVAQAIREQTAALVSAIHARDQAIEGLLQELAHYRRQTLERQTVEQSLIEALPAALLNAIAAMRADDPADEPRVAAPQGATGR